jgi:hypothetical protein
MVHIEDDDPSPAVTQVVIGIGMMVENTGNSNVQQMTFLPLGEN